MMIEQGASQSSRWQARRARHLSGLAAGLAAVVVAVPSIGRADATVDVCHSSDEAGGTNLRQALTEPLNPNTATNTITFKCPGSATIEVVGSPLEITQATAVDGGRTITLKSVSPNFRESMFVVATSGNFLYLRNLTLTHPNTQRQTFCTISDCIGTVVFGQGVTELDNVSVQNSDTPISMASGSLTISQSRFTGNSGNIVVSPAGATLTIVGSVFQDNPGAAPIVASGTVSITGSQFLGKSVASFFPGLCQLTIDTSKFQNNADAALQINCAPTTISNSLFANNGGGLVGGAIRFFGGAGQIMLRGDRFLNNNSPRDGGALWFIPPEAADASVSIGYSTFTGNRAGLSGGAIYVVAPKNPAVKTVMKLQRVSFSHNVATVAGGAMGALGTELLAARTVFADNEANGRGGAVALNNTAELHSIFANTLFVRNRSPSGSAYSGDDAEFINTTIDSNQGLAIEVFAPRTPRPIRLSNSIVSHNTQGCGPAGSPSGTFVDAGHNLQFPGTDCGASIWVAEPHLDTMYIPLPLSPPMGHGDLDVCRAPPINKMDVYGSARPSGGACAIGAAENVIHKRPACAGTNGPNRQDCYQGLINQLKQMLSTLH
jgi:hypothetical protein